MSYSVVRIFRRQGRTPVRRTVRAAGRSRTRKTSQADRGQAGESSPLAPHARRRPGQAGPPLEFAFGLGDLEGPR